MRLSIKKYHYNSYYTPKFKFLTWFGASMFKVLKVNEIKFWYNGCDTVIT